MASTTAALPRQRSSSPASTAPPCARSRNTWVWSRSSGRSITEAVTGSDLPSPEDLRQLERRGHLELVVRARARRLVGPPALELRRVAEPRPLHVIEGDLAHPLDPDRHPAEILAAVPPARRARHALLDLVLPAGPLAPRVAGLRPLAQRRQLVDQLAPARRGEARRDADVM